ncbi:CoA pyrophosphatase [Massilia sp. W12]|uniref:CoA pyrophosphatase n=1 Tax=Massilia sp. W12 TaxID=3126507 RepID=UPI0030D0BE6F
MKLPDFDPQSVPLHEVAGEAAVPPERLQADWLRARFAAPPLWQAEYGDEHRARMHEADLTPAAVLTPLVLRPDGITVLLTQRTAHLSDHAGQISFPGGRAEDDDADPVATALREAREEVGLDARHVEVLGCLPQYCTISGYRVTPVVALLHPPFHLQADPHEVAQLFEAPLAFLMDGAHHQRRMLPAGDGRRRSFYAMPWQDHFIWGATAAMLRNLFHFLRV